MKKFLIVIILIVLIGVGIVFCIDQNRMKNNEPVLFSTWGAKYAPPENEAKEKNSYLDFEIIVKISGDKKEEKILNNKDLYELNSDYDLYYVGLEEVNVKVNDKEMSLEDALENGYVTLDGIVLKANEDAKNGNVKTATYDDGGTMIYYYEDYRIKKMHTLDGNRDLYIMKNY